MNKQRMQKFLLVGEDTKENVADKKGAKLAAADCLWCDKPVWISQFGYTSDNPIPDVAIEKIVDDPKQIKTLHKWCLAEILDFGKETMRAMYANLKHRGEL